MASELKPGLSRNSSSEDSSAQMNTAVSPNQGNGSMSPCYSRDPPGSFHRTSSQRPPRLPSHTPPSASHTQSFPNSGHPSLQPTRPVSGTSGVGAPCPKPSIKPTLDHSSKGKEVSTSTKAPVKPTWVDVSVLPRIPKIRKDRNGNSTASSNSYGMPETGMNSLAGDKERKQSVDQQKGQSNGRTPRPGPDTGSSSSTFSNSFSSSSSSSPASHPRYSSSSSASSAVSFRINSSGNSWHSKRANVTPTSISGGSVQKSWKEKEDEAKKRRLHRDKRMLLASRTLASDGNNIYDPFNPTMSDSSDSDEESECRSPGSSSQHSTRDEKAPGLENKKGLVQNKQDLVPVKVETRGVDISEDLVRVKAETREVGISEDPVRVKAETQEVDISEEQQKTASGQEMISEEDYVKVKKESRVAESETVNQTLRDARIKKQPDLEDPEETKGIGDFKSLISEKSDTKPPLLHCLYLLKAERETQEEENMGTLNSACLDSNSSASSSAPTKNKQKSDSKSDSKSQSKAVDHKKKASRASKEHRSSSPDTDRGRRGDRRDSGQEIQQEEKKKDQESSTRRSRSKERRRRRRSCSTLESSRSSSPDKTVRKRRRSRSWSRSKERRRSRSVSGSSSRELSRNKRHKRRSDERRDERERDSERRRGPNSKRRGRSRSKSRSRSKEHKRDRSVSKSRSRSRSRERRKGQTRTQQSPLPSGHKGESSSKDKRRRLSRSSSRERRREGSSSKASQKTSGSSKDTKPAQTKKKEKDTIRRSLKQEEEAVVVEQETSSSAIAAKVKTKGEDVGTDGQATVAEEETVVRKEIKKEKRPLLDMFEDSPVTKPIKEGESLFEDSLITRPIKKEEPLFEGSLITRPIKKGEPMFEDSLTTRQIKKEEPLFEGSLKTRPIKKGEPMFEDSLITKTIKKGEPLFEGSLITKPMKKEEPLFEGSPVTKPIKKEEPLFEGSLKTKPTKKGEPLFEDSLITKTIKKGEPLFEGFPVTKPIKKEPLFEESLITKPIKKGEPLFEGSPVTKPMKKGEPLFEGSPVTKLIKKEEPLFEGSLITKPMKKEEPLFEPLSLITKPIKKEPVFEDSPEPIKEDEPIFEDYPEPIKEEPDAHVLMLEKEINAAGKEGAPIKVETCEIPMINSEPSFSEFPHSSLTAVVTPDSIQDAASGSHPELPPPAEQPNVAELTVPVKQEVRRPSDSDDDFNVDVMLDSLDRVKPEHAESLSVKREDAVEEGRKEGGQVLTAPGAKPKTQVKRVTWNIQEPEGPQPEKSASKLALYKLKLKQEGARRPSATGQSSSQKDIPGAISNSSKGNAALLSHPPRSDGAHPDEGDSSRKDTYLKKLHMQERAIEEVKLAIKPFYQRRDITKDEYKEIVRKAVQKVCHSKSGEINPVKVGNLVKAYVDKYKHARKHKRGDDAQAEFLRASDSP